MTTRARCSRRRPTSRPARSERACMCRRPSTARSRWRRHRPPSSRARHCRPAGRHRCWRRGKSHRFQITTTAGAANYYIDGTLMISHTSMAWGTAAMAPAIIDSTIADGVLTVDWIRTTPFAGSGTYTSSVFDAGAAVTWTKLTSTNTIVPYFSCCTVAGTTTVITYRIGDTPTPDGTWTPFTALGTAGAITGS